ncbi:MAG: MgtC/SapB family protein [Acidobacteriia bacterium]|nr:MgtC/SapB family protein [Terriglobia bacterium]
MNPRKAASPRAAPVPIQWNVPADVLGIAMGAVGGAAVGVERQWSGHATGPTSHFAGIRTFTLLGGLSGTAGWLWSSGFQTLAAVILIGAVAIVVAAYVAVSRLESDATTEVAALIVLAAGVLSGTGSWALASGIIVLTAILLVEKSRLHSLVARIPVVGLKAGFRFALMAVIILPLLPEGPYGPLGGIRPRELWTMVLLFSGISFLSYIIRSLLGAGQGYVVAGLLGGLVSSTNVTLSFSRMRSQDARNEIPLAIGVVAASTMLYFRVVGAASFLNPALGRAILPFVIPPVLLGVLFCAYGLRRSWAQEGGDETTPNPLQFRSALQMAGLFQIVLFVVGAASRRWGQAGLLAAGGILGLTDVDALVISMAKAASTVDQVSTAALATALGILANNALKLGVAIAFGRGRFRTLATSGLGGLALATALAIVLLH